MFELVEKKMEWSLIEYYIPCKVLNCSVGYGLFLVSSWYLILWETAVVALIVVTLWSWKLQKPWCCGQNHDQIPFYRFLKAWFHENGTCSVMFLYLFIFLLILEELVEMKILFHSILTYMQGFELWSWFNCDTWCCVWPQLWS